MATKRSQITERPAGMGKVFKGETAVASVRYAIVVVQQIIIARSMVGTVDEIPGLQDVTGRLTVLDGEPDLMDGNFILELSDGRRWEFLARSGDPVSRVYQLVNASGDGLPPLKIER